MYLHVCDVCESVCGISVYARVKQVCGGCVCVSVRARTCDGALTCVSCGAQPNQGFSALLSIHQMRVRTVEMHAWIDLQQYTAICRVQRCAFQCLGEHVRYACVWACMHYARSTTH